MNPYATLGLAPGAGKAEADAAFRRLAKGCHPDLNPGDPEAAARFMKLREAHKGVVAALAKPSAVPPRAPPASPANPRSGTSRPQRRDVRREIDITLSEAFTGGRVVVKGIPGLCPHCAGSGRVTTAERHSCETCAGSGISGYREKGLIRVSVACSDCGGTGHSRKAKCPDCMGYGTTPAASATVSIPPGCEDGALFRYEGAAGDAASGTVGDLEVVVRVRPDKRFRRVGNDVEAMVGVSVWEAALGGHAMVPSLDGKEFRLSVPSGTQHGRRFRLKGRGMPAPGGPGDLVAVIGVEIPDASSGPLRAAMEAVRAAASTR
jgi:DnaJ-class molecular chaperone